MKKEKNKLVDPFLCYPVEHSKHSRLRAAQRGITKTDIQFALNYCRSFFKQGFIFHVVLDSLIPDNLPPESIRKIKNLVIVIAGDSGMIITCYKSKNSLKHIKKKTKILKPIKPAA